MNTSPYNTKSQRGSMVIELVLIAAVLAVVGFVGYRYYQARHAATTTSAVKAESTTPNGTVENSVNALTKDADGDASVSNAADTDANQINADSSAASNVAGSIDESNF